VRFFCPSLIYSPKKNGCSYTCTGLFDTLAFFWGPRLPPLLLWVFRLAAWFLVFCFGGASWLLSLGFPARGLCRPLSRLWFGGGSRVSSLPGVASRLAAAAGLIASFELPALRRWSFVPRRIARARWSPARALSSGLSQPLAPVPASSPSSLPRAPPVSCPPAPGAPASSPLARGRRRRWRLASACRCWWCGARRAARGCPRGQKEIRSTTNTVHN